MTAWVPLLEGELAERAHDALEELGDALLAAPARTTHGPGLGPGSIGVALAHAYLDEVRPERGHLDRAGELLVDALDWFTGQPLVPWLYEGWTGLAFVLEHFARNFFELDLDPSRDPRQTMDAAVQALVARSPEIDGYEFFLGHSGHALYALERSTAIGAGLFESVLAALEQLATRDGELVTWFTPNDTIHVEKARYPRGHHNLAVGHGMAGCLGVLVSAHAAGLAVARTRRLVEGGIAWLERQRLPAGAPSVFPWILAPGEPPRPARTAWCDGDPGIAAILIRAGHSLGNPALVRSGLEVLREAASRPIEATGIVDAGLCHGAAGLAHVYNRMALATGGDPVLVAAARNWYRWILDRRQPGRGVGGFTYWHEFGHAWEPLTCFRGGAAGTALVLAAGLSPTPPAWDSLLLLS